MATSGTFLGPRTVTNGPQLRLNWSRIQTDIPGNRSLIRLTLQVYSQYYISFSAPKTGVLQGQSFPYSGGMQGTNITRTIRTRDVWVNHNSDGTKSQTFSGSFNINVYWQSAGRQVNTISVSGTAHIDRIPRQSIINSASNFTIGNNPSISVTRYHSSYTHDIITRIGNNTIRTWSGLTYSPSSLSFNEAAITNMYNATRNVNSATMRITLITKNGSTEIGRHSRDVTVTVGSNIVPVINSATVSENVSNIAADLGEYVQGYSRLSLAMTVTPGTGASISAYRTVANGQTYTSRTNTTGVLTNSGTQSVTFRTTDSRGRHSAVTSRSITVRAYTPPRIAAFSVARTDSSGNEDDSGEYGRVVVETQLSSINNKNTREHTIRYRKEGSGSSGWQTQTVSVSSYNYNGQTVIGPLSRDFAYEVEYTVEDYFRATSRTDTIPSEFTLMNFHTSGKGMAIGGVMQRAEGFDVFLNSRFLDGIYFEEYPVTLLAENVDLNNVTAPGMYFVATNARAGTISNKPINTAFSLLVERHAGRKQTFTRYHTAGEPKTWVRNFYSGTWGDWYEIQFK